MSYFIELTTTGTSPYDRMFVNVADISHVSPGPTPGSRVFCRSTSQPIEVLESYEDVKRQIRSAALEHHERSAVAELLSER